MGSLKKSQNFTYDWKSAIKPTDMGILVQILTLVLAASKSLIDIEWKVDPFNNILTKHEPSLMIC